MRQQAVVLSCADSSSLGCRVVEKTLGEGCAPVDAGTAGFFIPNHGLEIGREVGLKLDSGLPMQATVRALVPDENALTRTRPVRFTPVFKESGADRLQLAMNQSVTVMVPIGRPRVIVSVHKDAVIPRGGKNIVFVANEGKADSRAIRLGSAIGNRFEVVQGLGEGDVVVVRGNERLRPGQAITYEGMVKKGEAKPAAPADKQS